MRYLLLADNRCTDGVQEDDRPLRTSSVYADKGGHVRCPCYHRSRRKLKAYRRELDLIASDLAVLLELPPLVLGSTGMRTVGTAFAEVALASSLLLCTFSALS